MSGGRRPCAWARPARSARRGRPGTARARRTRAGSPRSPTPARGRACAPSAAACRSCRGVPAPSAPRARRRSARRPRRRYACACACPSRSRSSQPSLRLMLTKRTPADKSHSGLVPSSYQVTPVVLGRRRATRHPVGQTTGRQKVNESARRQPGNQPERSDVTADQGLLSKKVKGLGSSFLGVDRWSWLGARRRQIGSCGARLRSKRRADRLGVRPVFAQPGALAGLAGVVVRR